MIKNILILFTAEFSFGAGETFLETDIHYLSKGFNVFKIFRASQSPIQTRELLSNCFPANVDLEMSTFRKISTILGIFSLLFWTELRIICRVYGIKISIGILSAMLISFYRAKKVNAIVLELVRQESRSANQVFYSYWCDDIALRLALSSAMDPKIKTVSRMHRWDIYSDQSALEYLPYRHFITKHLHAIYCISEDGIHYTRDVLKVDTANIHLFRLGIEAQETLIERNDGIFTLSAVPIKFL